MVRCENGLKIRPERPRPRGVQRLITMALPTCASATTRSSTSRSWLFSALAIADSRHLRTSLAMRLRENSRSASALATFLPRISAATRLSFCGLTRTVRITAFASLSARRRGCFFLLIVVASTRLCRGRCGHRRGRRAGRSLRLAIGRVAIERAGRRKLAELVTDHFLGHQHGQVLMPVIDAKRQSNELRQDGRAPAPDLDHIMPARRAGGLRLREPIAVDERAFPYRARHVCPAPFLLRAWRLETMNLLVDLLLRVFFPLVGKPHGVTGWRPPDVRPSPPPCG